MILFFDTETTGLPMNWKAPVTDLDNWPRMVSIAWLVYDDEGNKISGKEYIIKPEGYTIPSDASRIHGISTDYATTHGTDLLNVLKEFREAVNEADYLVAHNMVFDEKVVGAELLRKDLVNCLAEKNKICTKESSTNYCALPGNKWPSLGELHLKLFRTDFEDAHTASTDVAITAKCFWELKKLCVLTITSESKSKLCDVSGTVQDYQFQSRMQDLRDVMDAYLDDVVSKFGYGTILLPEFKEFADGSWMPMLPYGLPLREVASDLFFRFGTRKINELNKKRYHYTKKLSRNDVLIYSHMIAHEPDARIGRPVRGVRLVIHESLEPFNKENPDADIKWEDKQAGIMCWKLVVDDSGKKVVNPIYQTLNVVFANNDGNYSEGAINIYVNADNNTELVYEAIMLELLKDSKYQDDLIQEEIIQNQILLDRFGEDEH